MYKQPIAIVRSIEHYQEQKEIDFVEVFRLLNKAEKILNRITDKRLELEMYFEQLEKKKKQATY